MHFVGTKILKSVQYKPLSYISRTKNREKKIQAAALISDFTVSCDVIVVSFYYIISSYSSIW